MRGYPGKVSHGSAQPGSLRAIRAAAFGLAMYAGAAALSPADAQTLQADGSVRMSGRSVRCGSIRTVMDPNLPSEGAASPGHVLVLNPRLLRQHSDTVRLFVFHHECGHHHVGASELRADCWGAEQGVKQGWLDRKGLREICQSFDGAPETETHPAGRRRCQNLDRCYTTALGGMEQQQAGLSSSSAYTARTSGAPPPPKLVRGPTLVSIGTLRPAAAANGKNCAATQTASSDLIGKLLERIAGSDSSANCR